MWEVSWRRNRLPHIDPKFLCIIAALFPHSAGLLNRAPEGPSLLSGAGSPYGILSPTATGTRTVTATRTELCLPRTPPNSNRLWHPVIWLFDIHLLPVGVGSAPNSTRPQVKVIFRYLRPDAPVSWLTPRSKVNMLHTYILLIEIRENYCVGGLIEIRENYCDGGLIKIRENYCDGGLTKIR